MRLGQKKYIENNEGKMLSFLRDSAPTVVELGIRDDDGLALFSR